MSQENQCSIRVGGDGPESEFFCCAFDVSESSASLLKLLPPVLVYRGSRTVEGTLDVLFAERTRHLPTEPGEITLQLAQILLITILRGNLEEGGVGVGLLSALAEPRLCRAITSPQSNLGNDWSVASLATAAGMSRASFSTTFHEKLGVTPMRFLHQCRMALAARLLTASQLSLNEIGSKIGYTDATSFSRAFRREFGTAPREYRRLEPCG